MPFNHFKTDTPGHVAFDDGITKVSTRVNSDGRTTVQFHNNPKALATWFARFQYPTCEKEKEPKLRRGSNVFLEEKKAAPGPRLNIAIHIVGSRGDVQPFIPIAQLLSSPPYNHRVRICTHPIFKDFVESNGLEFFSIGGDPEALMAYMVKNPGLLPSRESFKAGDIRKRRNEMADIINGAWRSCIESGNGMGPRITAAHTDLVEDLFVADAIVANPPSMAHIHCAEKLGIPLHMVFTMPWSPTQSFHHPLAAMAYKDAEPSIANYLSFIMMEFLTWQGLGDVINKFRVRTLKLDPISPLWGHQLLSRLRVPYTYLWPQSLIPKPHDWDHYIRIASFSFLSLAKSYIPPPDLTDFLEKGPTPIYIGFGSVVVENPQALTEIIFAAVERAGVRAIVSQGWGGIGGGSVPSSIFLVGNCPHDWLFKRVSCVVHHGGAGTTAAGLAAGLPTVVVPFFGDQPFWGQMVGRAGAGPNPVAFKEMTAETLASSIMFALKPEVRAAAEDVAEQIAQEDGSAMAASHVQEKMDVDSLRCDVCPDRLAVWTHKGTKANLSSLAAACLLNSGLMKGEDLKLVHHKQWYVDEGAEGPIVGIIGAFSGLFMEVAAATSLYVERLKTPPPAPQARRDSSVMLQVTQSHLANMSRVPTRAENTSQHATPRVRMGQLEKLALKMANKSFQPGDVINLTDDGSSYVQNLERTRTGRTDVKHGRIYGAARATGGFAKDLGKAGLKAPVAFFYNIANGARNLQSYTSKDVKIRRRREITGFGSGLKVSGEEFVLEFYDAFSGLVTQPYQGAKDGGAMGFGKGIFLAGHGLIFHVGSAIFGLPGYTLKGIEKGLSKRRLTKLKAEVILVRIRQGIEEYQQSTDEERLRIVERWKILRKA